MKIEQDKEFASSLMDLMRTKVAHSRPRGREEIHVSDLLMPRKAYWQRVDPRPPDDGELIHWLRGKILEWIVGVLTGLDDYRQESGTWNGIHYAVDFAMHAPVEFKSTRAMFSDLPRQDDYGVEQLSIYMLCRDAGMGRLVKLYLNPRREDGFGGFDDPRIECYRLVFEDGERERLERDTLALRDLILRALREGDHTLLPLCPQFVCYKIRREMIAKPYCETCDREFETDWGLNKHGSSKTGARHRLRRADYKENVLPTCKWFDKCDPFNTDPDKLVQIGARPVTPDDPITDDDVPF